MLLLTAACDLSSLGSGAAEGVKRSIPVTDALEEYRTARGAYPDSLAMLSPDFLPASALRPPDGIRDRYPLRYRRTRDTYELSFRYGSRSGECTYAPRIHHWECVE